MIVGGVKQVTWQFFTDSNGTVGPDKRLLDLLNQHNLPFVLWHESMLSLTRASKGEIATAHIACTAGIHRAQVRLRAHLHDTDGPEADGTLPSLSAVGAWFLRQLSEGGRLPTPDWLPSWWDPKMPLADSAEETAAPFTREQLLLIDEVQAYAAEVVMNEVPAAKWVIYRGQRKDWRNGDTVLELKPGVQFYPLTLVYLTAVGVVLMGETPSGGLLFEKAAEVVLKAS